MCNFENLLKLKIMFKCKIPSFLSNVSAITEMECISVCMNDLIRDHSLINYAKIYQKTSISYPRIRTRMCAYQRVRNVSFSENFAYVPNRR